MKRWDIINTLIAAKGYKTYLEIGYGKGKNFKEVNLPAEQKMSVDPDDAGADYQMTSDEFFDRCDHGVDIIFIDGLHHEAHVTKDIKNSLEVLNEGGIIVVHDCLPADEAMQKVPREQKQWTGDVWKAMVKLRANKQVEFEVIDTDYGVGLIWKAESKNPMPKQKLTWENFVKNMDKWLKVVSVEGSVILG